ncbi:putative Porin [Vibrio nigripulchritudo SO65]|uniref:TonB-dependent receptor domain-containing protein n=1 Tax=Vibrio nigripulchritudo TaxID=28173 RepID=UPI0003B1DCA0|nr:TonB-dependent receptor [Vibrio nigripulchritudo]CCN33778.1 putative Porin [Vibrio nigripulchritudo AM115]CCN41980.1 putative Porin [Vibrio nigripulchritudo FTn2]CCN66228.1 putative Porin [Vibrio nigripulchritudo POn4]CCN74586.1 putative Porin [Vibrio nigripulchritudo SO65]
MKLLKLSCAVAAALSVAPALAQENDEVMVVTGTSSQVSVHQAPASVTVVTSEEINKIPATDITDALGKLAGLQVENFGGSEPSIKIRGLDSAYTLLLVNGRKISSKDAIVRGSFDMSSIPLSAIDRVEVVRGPMSTLYGSEAIGGVVNVILKEPTEETFVAGSVGYKHPQNGGGALKNGSIFVSGSLVPDTILYHANVDVSDRDAWEIDDKDAKYSNLQESQKRLSVDTTVTWLTSDSDKVLFDLGFMKDDRVAPLGDRDSNKYKSERVNAGVGYEREWNWGVNSFNYYYEDTKILEDNSHPLLKGEMTGTQRNHSLDGKAVFAIDNHTVTTGFDFSRTEISHTKFYTDNETNQQGAIYVQDEIAIADPLTLTVSGRYTKHNEFGTHFSPRAYLVFQATDNLTLKGGYGEGFKAPNIWHSSDKLLMISCGGRCYLQGNSDLKPETSKSFELTAVYNQPTWFVQGTVFHNQLKDMISRDTQTTVGIAPDGKKIISMININEVETKGIEIDGEFDLSDSVYLTTNLTYTDAKDKKADEKLAYTPEIMANAGLNWSATDELTLFTDVKYTGDQVYTHYDRATKTSEVRDLKPYTTIDLGGSYQVNNDFKIKAGVTNITDHRLYEQENDYNNVDVGRAFYAAVDFEF